MKGEQRIPAVEEEIKRMGRDVKNFVEAVLELYLNGSVDQAYEVAAMDEKINHYFDSIRDFGIQKKSRKIQMLSLQVVITSK